MPTESALRPIRRNSPTLMSSPMVTMKKSMPTRAIAARPLVIGPVGGKSHVNVSGERRPRIVGPSRSPPAISPTTAGMPSRRAACPSTSATNSIAARCNESSVQSSGLMGRFQVTGGAAARGSISRWQRHEADVIETEHPGLRGDRVLADDFHRERRRARPEVEDAE